MRSWLTLSGMAATNLAWWLGHSSGLASCSQCQRYQLIPMTSSRLLAWLFQQKFLLQKLGWSAVRRRTSHGWNSDCFNDGLEVSGVWNTPALHINECPWSSFLLLWLCYNHLANCTPNKGVASEVSPGLCWWDPLECLGHDFYLSDLLPLTGCSLRRLLDLFFGFEALAADDAFGVPPDNGNRWKATFGWLKMDGSWRSNGNWFVAFLFKEVILPAKNMKAALSARKICCTETAEYPGGGGVCKWSSRSAWYAAMHTPTRSNAKALRFNALDTSSSVTVGHVRSDCFSLTTSCDWSIDISLLGFCCKSSWRLVGNFSGAKYRRQFFSSMLSVMS